MEAREAPPRQEPSSASTPLTKPPPNTTNHARDATVKDNGISTVGDRQVTKYNFPNCGIVVGLIVLLLSCGMAWWMSAIKDSTEVINAGGDSMVSGNGYNSWGQLPGPAANDSKLDSSVNSLKPPVWIVPFGRNRDFVGREEILERLLKIILSSGDKDVCQRTAIDGPGGVGKTQIALEAAFRIRDQHPDYSVFWVPAVDVTSFDNAFREIGRQLQLKGIDGENLNADVKLLVKNALSQSAASWLLIIDNANDLQFFSNTDALAEATPLSDYLPFSPTGSILFTTRNHEAIVGLDIPSSNVIAAREMGRDEAIKLLQQNLEKPQIGDAEITNRLLDFLAGLPLAIKQASAYMAKTGISTAQYLEHCQSSDKNLVGLLSKEFEDWHGYNHQNIKNPVATTWLISFQQISRDNKFAAQHLRFMCFLAETDIPASLLPPADDERDTKEAIGVLKAYGFITERIGSSSFDIHHWVRLPMRSWLESEMKVEKYVTSVLHRLANVFPRPDHENPALWTRYLPHAQTALGGRKDAGDENDLMALLRNVGHSLVLLGRYYEGLQIYRQEVRLMEKVLGIEHPNTLSAMNTLAAILASQRKYEEAEAMHQQTLRLREKVLGIDHADTLTSMGNLANVLGWHGKYEEAEAMHQQKFKLLEKTLGIQHPDTLTTMNYVAHMLAFQGKYEEAEAMHRQTFRLKEKALGIEQSDTIHSWINLAVMLHSEGKYEEAEAMYRQELKLMEKVLGIEHPDTLTGMNNLALVLTAQEKHKEAETIQRQTCRLRERVLGIEHPHTLNTMGSLALMLYSQGKYKEAEAIYQQTLKLKEKVLGTEHPDTLTSMHNLALVLHAQGKYEEAETIQRQTCRLRESVLGAEHPDTLKTMGSLALVLYSQGKYEEAEAVHWRTLKLKKVLGTEHPDTLTLMNNLAIVLYSQGKYEEAEAMNQQTLRMMEKVLGTEHPSTLNIMNNLTAVLYNQGKYEGAEAMNRQTFKLREKVLGIEHPDTLTSMNNLALVLYAQGKYEEAETIQQQTHRLRESVLGAEHPDTLKTMGSLAHILYSQGKYEEAEAMYRQTLKLKEKVLGTDHPDTLTLINNLAIVLYYQGKYEEAEAMHRQTLRLREKVLGIEHPDTLTSMGNLADVLERQGKYEEAEAMHWQTLELMEKILGIEHSSTRRVRSNLADCLKTKDERGKQES